MPVFVCRRPPECYVYSISEGGPHPAAGPGPLKIDFEPVFIEDGFNTIEDLQIFGDMIAWSITDDRHSAVHVWNWKTSVLLWVRSSCPCKIIRPKLTQPILTRSTAKATPEGHPAG